MILKTLRIKKPSSFGRLVNYVLTHEGKVRDEGFLLTHNIMSDEAEGITQEFTQNDAYRTTLRKNSVRMYHEILSFAPEDTQRLTAEKLEDLAQHYVELRGHRGLAIAKPHFEKSHWHIHFLLSGSEYRSDRLLRMDNKRFEQVRRGIEAYQQERYPELSHSIVYLDKPEKERLNRKEQDKSVRKEKAYQAKRKGQILDKERIAKAVQEMYHLSKNARAFLSLLDVQEEIEVYYYREKPAGIKYGRNKGRKYRFATIGITKDMLRTLEQGKTKEKTAPKLWQMILSDKKLQEYIQAKRQSRQEAMLERYKEARESLSGLEPKKQQKAVKTLLMNVLDSSKTMKQFQYFLGQLGLQQVVADEKLSGVKLDGKGYDFKELGMREALEAKHKTFERYQSWKTKHAPSKETTHDIELGLQIGGSGIFF